MAKPPQKRDYRNTLYIFPVFLPLAELLPWLLTIIAALAAFAQFLSRSIWAHPVRRGLVLGLSLICLIAASVLAIQRWGFIPSAAQGSTPVPTQELSTLQTFQLAPKPPSRTNATTLTLLWSAQTPHQNIGKPMIAGNLLMTGTYSGTVDAFSLADGSPVWTLQKHEQIFSTPAIARNTAFVGEGHHTSPASVLTYFSFPDGKPLWERTFRSHIESYPVFDEAKNSVWLGAGETGLWALRMTTGEVLWHTPIGHTDIPPLLNSGELFAVANHPDGKDGSAWHGINPADGKIIRSVAIAGNPMCNMLADDKGTMFFATATGQVGVKRTTDAGWAHSITHEGVLRWTVPLPAMPMPEGVMLRDGSLLFYTLNDGTLLALRTSDGNVVWQQKIGTTFNTDATLIEEGATPKIVAITSDGLVTIRNAITGGEITHFSVEKGDSYPLYRDHVLYIATPYVLRAYAGLEGSK